jgi:pyruvate/2-oxoglutarate dehydrogenase complex dihydrolipoamide dehydrogenase (E3) component
MLVGNRIFINVGGRARIPDLPGIGRIPVLTNSSILKLTELPRHLMIVGGSYVALEFAQMFRRFGAAVTVIEQGRHLIGREDVATSDPVRALMESEGIAIRTNATCIGLDGTPTEPVVALDCADGAQTIAGSHVLLATGRVPNTDDLGLDAAGIAVDRHGYVMVNDRLETDVESIWALGDCNGRGAFTHTAYNDYEIVADNLLESADRRISDRIDTYALYVDPPLARVGLSIEQARRAGHRVLVGRRPMSRVSRAVEKGEATGFMEIVVDGHSDAILGATIFGVGGDEAIHCILDLMYARSSASMLRRAVHIHPTVSELLPTIAGELIAAEQ